MGRITFNINQSYFDNYKRSYQKLQSLLAEVMSVINLIFQIGRLIINFLIEKRMSKDIMISLINKNTKDIKHNKSIKIKNKFITESGISSKLKMEISELNDKKIIVLL